MQPQTVALVASGDSGARTLQDRRGQAGVVLRDGREYEAHCGDRVVAGQCASQKYTLIAILEATS